jgi:glycolate oxidase iron-sulfur subunit
VNYAVLFETARSDIQASGVDRSLKRRFWRAIALRFLFMHPRALRGAARLLRFYQRSGLELLIRRSGLTRILPADVRRLEPQAPRIAPAFSNALVGRQERPPGTPQARVALLTGCVQDLVFPDVNRDTADVLLANGCAVDTPSPQPCCGSLHAHNGDLQSAVRLARRMIDLIPPGNYDAIITNAGGCGSHLRHYAALLADDPTYRDRARAWDAKLRDVQEWLMEIGCRPPAAAPFDRSTSVTYHESCHLVHGQKISRQPRALLALIPGISLVELAESSWCCGSAGIYALTQPAQADALLDRKVKHIERTNASIVATANPGCHLQIARGLGDVGSGVRVAHPVSLLARAYRAEGVASRESSPHPRQPPAAGRTAHSADRPSGFRE